MLGLWLLPALLMGMKSAAPTLDSQQEGEIKTEQGRGDNIIEHRPYADTTAAQESFSGFTNHGPFDQFVYHKPPSDLRKNCSVEGTRAYCSHLHLEEVPQNLDPNITLLTLAYNNLSAESLHPGVFSRYSKLRFLYLDYNYITTLPDGIFDGLTQLEYLSLFHNQIQMNDALRTSTVFSPLNSSLFTLILSQNNNASDPSLRYPDQALSNLTNLTVLYMDGLRYDFQLGQGFQNLTNLRNLTMTGYLDGNCEINTLENNTFEYVRSLHFLNLSDCTLSPDRVHEETFSFLTELRGLDISNNFGLGIDTVGRFMKGLKDNKNFRYLFMQRITTRFASCIVVYRETLQYFANTSLEVIFAPNNEIEMIEIGALEHLPPTLRFVNFTNNKNSFGAYWKDMASLTGLEELYIDNHQLAYYFPGNFPPSDLHCGRGNSTARNHSPKSTKCLCGEPPPCMDLNATDGIILPLPPNLKVFSSRSNSVAYRLKKINFCPNNSLEIVDFSSNMFQRLEGTITGLEHLKSLALTDSFIQFISDSFFDSFKALKSLNLFQNLLGDRLAFDTNGNIFDSLEQLTYLNISFNNIFRLHKDTFRGNSKLQVLDISTNRLRFVNFSIAHMEDLKFLDLHKNNLYSLPLPARKHISLLLRQNKTVRVSMASNPIMCNCDNLDFLEWVVETKIFGANFSELFYYCSFPGVDISKRMESGYEDIVQTLRRQCANHVVIFLAVSVACLVVVIVIIIALIHRFRWTLRYWYHAARSRIDAGRSTSSDESRFEFDVFVSYAHDDTDFVRQHLKPQLEDRRGLRLMVHGERFQAGRHISDNIYMAVAGSRRTLVVLTRSLLASHWCIYELQMAQQEAVSTGRNVLVFLFKEDIPARELDRHVLSYIRTNTYIAYPRDRRHYKAFWDKLAQDLRST
ncbi:toll-like receptor 4 [Aplysia californica]|uniref:Toll-like receptor 4 n=1 Tax=Aplysia californica TaxID=6500 RepID=A0ABM0ZUN7_APLCA|nr:toll-like receptor 4 [Aplysia californica]